MVSDAQVRLLRQKRMEGKTQEAAAAAAGMSVRTARTWARGPLPAAGKTPRSWRTRPDPFAAVWEQDWPSGILGAHRASRPRDRAGCLARAAEGPSVRLRQSPALIHPIAPHKARGPWRRAGRLMAVRSRLPLAGPWDYASGAARQVPVVAKVSMMVRM